jgi:hypothetical protein
MFLAKKKKTTGKVISQDERTFLENNIGKVVGKETQIALPTKLEIVLGEGRKKIHSKGF